MNKKQQIIATAILATSLTLAGCNNTEQVQQPQPQKAVEPEILSFKQASQQFIDDYWLTSPNSALAMGYHKYDHILSISDEQSRQKTLAFIDKQQKRFAQFNADSLSENDRIDLLIIQSKLKQLHWYITEEKAYQWRPDYYNIAYGFAQIINGSYDSLENRLKVMNQRLTNVPKYYQVAFNNITVPTLEHTQLAISQNQGTLALFGDKLMAKIDSANISDAEKAELKQKIATAKTAINGYVNQLQTLEKELVASGKAKSFRIGSALYEQKFAFDIQSQYSAKQLYDKAIEDKNAIQVQMTKLTDELWFEYFPDKIRPRNNTKATGQLIKHIAKRHVKRENFVDEIRAQIPALEKFVREKDLMTLDPSKPLVVRETPLYQRGFAGASINPPGPFDKNANTYYNVTPLDAMDEETAESYLREYNHWMLQILNIHEAIPGHYTQLVYANQSPSLIKSIFYNGAMVEGWAVYTERMMLEQGYGDFEKELWLMYYKWNLRVIANTILDYSIHNLDMTKAQALDLLINQAFQEKAEAEGKWRRATLSQVQLTSYYSGYREIYDFREELKAKQGADFDLKQFHEQFLSYGKAPVKHIKQLMRAK